MALIQEVLEIVRKRNPHEPEFLQAVTEVLESIRPVIGRRISMHEVAGALDDHEQRKTSGRTVMSVQAR